MYIISAKVMFRDAIESKIIYMAVFSSCFVFLPLMPAMFLLRVSLVVASVIFNSYLLQILSYIAISIIKFLCICTCPFKFEI